jgi:endonuclease/exonuclease/phosphatase family metal-dependent hydrolase
MKKTTVFVIPLAIYFLFLIQLAGSLVESIYILDLMNTSLDEKALGVLFFFSPVLLLFYPKKRPAQTVWFLFGLLFLARCLTPYLDTLGRMLASGIGLGGALMLFPFLITARPKSDSGDFSGLQVWAGLALAVGISVFLRTVNYGLDYSLVPEGSWAGWGLGAVLGYGLTHLDWNTPGKEHTRARKVALPTAGVFLVIGLTWFAFSAPAVIARWTEADYRWIVSIVSLLVLAWVWIFLGKSEWIERIPPTWLLVWNLSFTLALTLTILAHRVPFPQMPDAAFVVVGTPTWIQQVPLVIMLLLFPVIFLDLRLFSKRILRADPSPRDLIPGMLLGTFSLVVLVFMQIFTNVWGYVEPVSPWFRNKFWLPYLLLAGAITALIGWRGTAASGKQPEQTSSLSPGWAVFLALLFLVTAGSALATTKIQTFEPRRGALLVMTYNIQQANDETGERSYQEQLALIRQVGPDILALQESDATRISLNNNDFVRYYAGQLGYHSYYGPTTVSGTYGTAILSKYPLQNTRTVFPFSDQDEIGTAVAEIEAGGERFSIYNVHPDGSDTAMLAWAESLLEHSKGQTNVISLGDYNLRDYEEAYQLVASVYTNAWESIYPSKISLDGTDMSGENRIDHIFFSHQLTARNPIYLLPPDSATDHPVHWAEITWGE